MNILDYILLGLILLTAAFGFRSGLLRMIGSLVGLVIATLLASRFYPNVADWFGGTNMSQVIAFLLIFGLSIKLITLLFWVIGKVFQIVTVLPFVSSVDKVLGLVLGLAEGILIVAMAIYFINKYPFNDWLMAQMSGSVVAPVLLIIAQVFLPLLPEALKKIKSYL